MNKLNQMLVGYFPTKNARNYPDKTAVVFKGSRMSFKETNDRACCLANSLLEMGIEKGDRVCILLNNCHNYMEIYFACAKIGAISTPINNKFSESEIAYIMNNSEAVTLIAGHEFIATINSIRSELPHLKHLIYLGKETDGALSYGAVIDCADPVEPHLDMDDDETIFLVYTSGTTGNPKGAMLTHRTMLSACQAITIHRQMTHKDIYVYSAPLYHVAGICGMIATFFVGATSVILEGFEPKLVLEAIEKEKATTAFLVPTMLMSILDDPDLKNYNLSSIRRIFYGAAPMPPPLIDRALKEMKVNFFQAYGMTEVNAGYITYLGEEDHIIGDDPEKERRLYSVGREGINAEVRIFSEEDRELPNGEIGEVVLRGQHIMKGYWKDPEKTARTLRNGWMHTGDMGYFDDGNYLFLVDRKKDMVISGGVNIYPREIEDVLLEHPSVKETAVIGVPDEKWGEAIKAFIILEEAYSATEDEIIEHCKSFLASFKKPKYVEFVNDFPRNPSGKVLKKVLREREWEIRKTRM